MPAAITTLYGTEHRFTLANDRSQQLLAGRVAVAGRGRVVKRT